MDIATERLVSNALAHVLGQVGADVSSVVAGEGACEASFVSPTGVPCSLDAAWDGESVGAWVSFDAGPAPSRSLMVADLSAEMAARPDDDPYWDGLFSWWLERPQDYLRERVADNLAVAVSMMEAGEWPLRSSLSAPMERVCRSALESLGLSPLSWIWDDDGERVECGMAFAASAAAPFLGVDVDLVEGRLDAYLKGSPGDAGRRTFASAPVSGRNPAPSALRSALRGLEAECRAMGWVV